jgi:Crp-like helix-turn-helix domain
VKQVARMAACNAVHTVEQRYIRRLLTADDSTPDERLKLIHENFSEMLGVRRAGISIVAKRLQAAGLIEYGRGEVGILNRPQLEARACSCYRALKRDEARVVGA